ncbi:MAG: hypothetical protein B7Z78_13555 [Rhodospirillales bacterium 20-60-12]|nr:MAG: hypothetical protein B7Z78_13555 [Rhodospirillales bacterium 20-60-12]HQT67187.1 Crp/Fnr family transcriptional regulator [Acetobacteraceae bacterium]
MKASVTRTLSEDLSAAFPSLAELEPGISDIIADHAAPLSLPAGRMVFEIGQSCERFLLLQSGSVRVHLLNDQGHEIILYRIVRGETCILSTASLLSRTAYTAYAVTESEVTAIGIPQSIFHRLMAHSDQFRGFVFAAHARRLTDLMGVVADVAFIRIRVRLARCLLQRADQLGKVEMTHEAIAVELGTAREVISRNLKILEREGYLTLGLGVIIIKDPRAMSDHTKREFDP